MIKKHLNLNEVFFSYLGGKMLKSSCCKNFWLLLISLLLIASGIYVLFNPISALISSVIFIGIFLLLIGSGYLLSFQENDSYAILALGILDIFLGLIFLTNIGITALTLPIIWAFWIMFNSIIQIAMGMELKNTPNVPYKQIIGAGVFGVLFSTLIFIYPAVGTFTITILLGFYLIGYGVFELYRLKSCNKKTTKGETV